VNPPICFSSRVAIPDTVLFREFSGEAVILDLASESYLGLNDVGTRMWAELTTQPSVQAAYDALLSEYDVPPETLRADLEGLLGQLLEQGLITLEHE
jgi:hypothetical protein